MKDVVIAIVAVAVAASAAAPSQAPAPLPDYVETCPRDRPDFDSCLRSSVQKFLPYLVKGVPELDLQPFDPFVIDEIVSEYSNGFVAGTSTARDVTTYGLAETEFLNVRTNFEDPSDMSLTLDVFIGKIKSDGKFKVQGKFLETDLGSRGTYSLSVSNITAALELRGSLETINGVDYMKITKFDVRPEVGDMKIFATNIYGPNEALTKASLELFNQYWRPVFNEFLPYARVSWDKIMRKIANRVFLRVPFDVIFPTSS